MSDKKKKSRVGRAVKPEPDKPAVFEPGPDELRQRQLAHLAAPVEQGTPQANGQFDPAAVVKRENVWWLNGSKRYFRPAADGVEWISVGEQDIKRKLRLAGVFSRAAEGQSFSQADRVMDYIQDCRHVDFAGRLAGYKAGVHYVQDRPIIVLGTYTLVEPVKGEWPVLGALLEGMLKTPDFDQRPYFFAWLKVAITALRAGERRGGHALIFVGASDCGKSFLQEHVITPLLGKRSADPTAYMLNKTTFNAELLGSEHLAIQELPSGLDRESRAFLGEQLKKIVATEGHSYHPKGLDAVTMYPFWRVTISINKNPERIKSLPPINSDIADKIMLFLVESKPMPMAARTVEERRAFRTAIYSELPAFVHFLLEWQIPPDLMKDEHADRFGVAAFHHQQIIHDLFEQEPESGLLYMIDNEVFKPYDPGFEDGMKPGQAWGWNPAMHLHEQLTAEACRFAAQAKRLFSYPGACGSLLSKLHEKMPQRFLKKHTNAGNVWMIHPPN
jgi:hypothetical protein